MIYQLAMLSGERLKELRTSQGLTQKELGKRVGLSQQAINLLEHEQRKLTFDLYVKLCNVLDPNHEQLVQLPYADFYRDDFTGERTPEQEDLYISNKIMGYMNQLNKTGQEKAFEQVELLTKIPEYRKDAE